MLLVIILGEGPRDALNGTAEEGDAFLTAHGQLTGLGDDLKVEGNVGVFAHGGDSYDTTMSDFL